MKSTRLASAMRAAVDLHLEGHLTEAEAKYREALRLDPSNYDSCHLLGVIRLQQGRFSDAAEFMRRALRQRPSSAEAHYTLAVVLKELKRWDEAVRGFRRAVEIRPDYAEAFNGLGGVLYDLGQFDEAAACHRRALELVPNDAGAHRCLGNALHGLGRHDDAAGCYRRSIALAPDCAETHNNLGVALSKLCRHSQAVVCLEKALEAKPDYAEAHNNLGIALGRLDRPEAALAAFDRALGLKPDYAEAHNNRGLELANMNRYGEAIACYARALAGKPDYAEAHFNEGLARLVLGDYAAGWPEYEWRWRTEPFLRRGQPVPAPAWNGEPLEGRTILLHAEQGLGDTLQFARYAEAVAARGGRVVLEVQPTLKPLLRGVGSVSELIAAGEPRPPVELHCPLLSLPGAFGTRSETIPPPATLRIPADRLTAWQTALGAVGRPRIGLVWAGSQTHERDRHRSIHLQQLLSLAALPGLGFVSLQKDLRPGDDALLASARGLVHVGDRLRDFADTAAALSQLDLLISVDTSVVHLAGTLGLPCWVLLPFVPDWRWLLGREDSPWYPSVRLVRQTALGDWDAVLARVAEDLARMSIE